MAKTNKFFIYGALGNIIEWYDFTLYGYFAVTLSTLFFRESHLKGLIMVFIIFAIGYLIRPLGGIFYGRLGDKFGRKKALLLSIVLMTISTTLIGCLPTTTTIGSWAALLLLLLRMLQGFSAGGETSGVFTYVIEHCDSNKRGFYGGSTYAVIVFGILLASLVATLIQTLFTANQILAWGWRLGFWLSGLLGSIILLLRLKMPESPVYENLLATKKIVASPFLEVMKNHKLLLWFMTLLIALPASGFYFVFIFLPTASMVTTHISDKYILLINSLTLLVMIIAMPLFGILSDKKGRYPILLLAASLLLIVSFPSLIFLYYYKFASLVIIQSLLGLLIALFEAPLPAFMVEATNPEVRYSIIAIAYNLSFSIFGGLAPLVATYLLNTFKWPPISSLYLVLCAVISLMALIKINVYKNSQPIKINSIQQQ